jgi:hypothetical protein
VDARKNLFIMRSFRLSRVPYAVFEHLHVRALIEIGSVKMAWVQKFQYSF